MNFELHKGIDSVWEDEVLRVDNVNKYFGNYDNIFKVLNNVNLTVKRGEFIGIMGSSGSGKTTFLNCIATIDSMYSGKIIINGQDIKKLKYRELNKFRKNDVGFVFQEFSLLETFTVYENIALALSINGKKDMEMDEIIYNASECLDILNILIKYPRQLSGGQKQKVAFVRAIVNNPPLILADEPTGALDYRSSKTMLLKMININRELNTTILMSTHDVFAASFTNRVLFIKDGTIFKEMVKGAQSRKEFFDKIVENLFVLGGDEDVF